MIVRFSEWLLNSINLLGCNSTQNHIKLIDVTSLTNAQYYQTLQVETLCNKIGC